MNSSSSFDSKKSFSLLLQGSPKTGKTCIAMTFPKPWFLQADRNLRSAVERYPDKEFWYDYMDTDAKGNALRPDQHWPRLEAVVKAACIDPGIKTIILDSLTPIGRALEDYVVSQGGTGKNLVVGGVKVMDLSLWRPYKILLAKLISMVQNSGKYCIFIVHDKEVETSSGMTMLKPNIGGEMKDVIYSLFTDVWRTDIELMGMNPAKYVVQAAPIAKCKGLTSTLDLPSKFVYADQEAKIMEELV